MTNNHRVRSISMNEWHAIQRKTDEHGAAIARMEGKLTILLWVTGLIAAQMFGLLALAVKILLEGRI